MLALLWDESHLWGLLVWRALEAFGLEAAPVRCAQVADGWLDRNRPDALVVPGGVARRKSLALGDAGKTAIRRYLQAGGAYLGFCGGSGLGLTGEHGLAICPWTRAPLGDRLLHLVSGHIHVSMHAAAEGFRPSGLDDAPLAPVWWPARFEPAPHPDVEVLASYAEPGEDFWVADIPLAQLPASALDAWEAEHGVAIRPRFLSGQPCVVRGRTGKGQYLLSYAHLETPDSPQANAWLAHLLERLGGQPPLRRDVPAWDLGALSAHAIRWDEPVLLRAWSILEEAVTLGREHLLLFPRTSWLLGWRAGLPGAHLNHFRSLLHACLTRPPVDEAAAWLEPRAGAFADQLERFHRELHGYLLAERLAMTFARSLPDTVSRRALTARREALFGTSMEPGGLFAPLLEVVDETAWRVLAHRP